MRRALELVGMLLLERPELVDGVVGGLLQTDAPVEVGEGDDVALDLRVGAGRARVAVGHGVADALAPLVQEHEVDAPGVDADGGDLGLLHRRVDALLDRLDERVDVPAVVPAAADLRVVETIDLLEGDLAVLHPTDDVPAAGRADVYGKKVFHMAYYTILSRRTERR